MEMGLRDVRRGGGTNRLFKKQSGSGLSAKSKKKGMLKKLGLSDEKLNSSFIDHNNSKKQEMMGYEFSCSDLEEEVSRKKSRIPKKNLKDTNGVDHASVPRKLRSAMKKKKRNLESVSKQSSASKRLNRSKTGIESLTKENEEMEAKAIVSESMMMMMISNDEKEVAETLYGLAGMFTETEKTCEKETSKVESSLVVEADFSIAEESLEPAVSVISSDKTKQIDEMPLEQSSVKQPISKGLKQSSSVDVTDSPVRAIESKVARSDTDYKSNGLALWPGLSRAHVLSKPSSTKLPPWMGQAVSPSKSATEPLRIQPRKLKKCASHIYIARLIKVLQSSKGSSISNTPLRLDQNELRCSETSHRLSHPVTTTISGFKTTVSSPSKRYQYPHMLDLHRTHNPKPVQEDMTQLALNLYNPHNPQSYDFLSLSSSAGASSSSSQSHFPLLNSLPQYHHHHHISAAYNTQQLSPATSSHQIQQISPYLASRFQTAYNANQQQQQQLQKRLWAAAQYRPPPTNGNAVTPLSNQFSKPNLSLNLTSSSQCSSIQQPLQVASSPRYINNNNNVSHHFQQQHRLMAAAMSPMSQHHHHHHHNNLNRQEHQFPLIYEDTRTPLQLLCNEQS